MRAIHGNIVERGTTGSDLLDFSWLGNKGYGVDYVTLGGKDKVVGTTFDDSFTLGRDPETIDGGNGWDTVNYANSTSGVNVDLNTTVQHGGYAEGDQLTRIESVTGSQYNDTIIGTGGHNDLDGQGGNDKIYAGDGMDTLHGGDGNDYLFGEGDNDTIYGDNGADYIDGGSGRDLVDYSQSTAGVNVNLNRTMQYGGFAEGDQLYNVENITGSQYRDVLVGNGDDNVIDGQAGDDKIYGGDGNDTLYGGDGNDFLSGDTGNDTMYGGDGNDTMRGGTGTNYFDGGDGIDTVDYRAAAHGAVVDLDSTYFVSGEKDAQGHYYSTDTYTSVENVQGSNYNDGVFGTADDNVIDGNGGDDLLFGFDGNDTIDGGDQNDIIEGGAGADKLDGGTGVNTLSYSFSSAGVQHQPRSRNRVRRRCIGRFVRELPEHHRLQSQ